MKIIEYLTCFLKDFFVTCGCLMVTTSIFFGFYSIETIKSTLFLQIILGALAYTFYKYAFVNRYEVEKKTHLINFIICSTLANIMIILWLFLFSPGKIIDKNLIIIYIIIIFIVKGAVFAMMYIDGLKQAKQLNEKLSEYQNVVE